MSLDFYRIKGLYTTYNEKYKHIIFKLTKDQLNTKIKLYSGIRRLDSDRRLLVDFGWNPVLVAKDSKIPYAREEGSFIFVKSLNK